MAMKKKTGKNTSKPSASAREPMTDRLEARKQEIRKLLQQENHSLVADLMKYSTENMMIVDDLLSDDHRNVQLQAALALATLVERGHLSLDLVKALTTALSNKHEVIREQAACSLEVGAKKGMDIFDSVEALARLLSDDNENIRLNAADALKAGAENGRSQTKEKIVSGIIEFLNSKRFRNEADLNSHRYLEMIGELDQIVQTIDKTEREAARKRSSVRIVLKIPE